MSMEPVVRLTDAPDKDAEYVLRRIKLIEEIDAAIKDRSRERDAARLESGLRLIDVHNRLVRDSGLSRTSPKSPFGPWLEASGINRRTAYDHMQYAGFTEEQRTASKKTKAAKKKTKRKQKAKAEAQDIIIQAPCDDCNNEEERWQRSFSALAGDAISMPAYWTREFGKWDDYEVTTAMLTLAEQAAASWQQMVVTLTRRRRK